LIDHILIDDISIDDMSIDDILIDHILIDDILIDHILCHSVSVYDKSSIKDLTEEQFGIIIRTANDQLARWAMSKRR
jgi:hypothetical protein